MDFKLDLSLDLQSIQSTLKNDFRKRSEDIVRAQLNEQMRDGSYWNSKPGPTFIKIRDMLNAHFDSDEAQATIQKLIDQHWEEALTKATMEAIDREAMKVATKRLKKEKNLPQYKGH